MATYGFFRTICSLLAAMIPAELVVATPEPSSELEITMTDGDEAIPRNNVIKIDDDRIKGYLDRGVRGADEETELQRCYAAFERCLGAPKSARSSNRLPCQRAARLSDHRFS